MTTYREPDWDSLSEINFLIHRRMSEHLNAALSAISLLESPEAAHNPDFWRERALRAVLNTLDLHNAWASLVRNKLGEHFLPQHMLHFRASELLNWLATELELGGTYLLQDDIALYGNRETLQEALLLLHSCASTLGPDVRLMTDSLPEGVWFRVRYTVVRTAPPALDKLLEALDSLPKNWRARSAAFMLRRAMDFLAMNGCALDYALTDNGFCDFGFFVRSANRDVNLSEVLAGAADTQPENRPFLGDDQTSTRGGKSGDNADAPARKSRR